MLRNCVQTCMSVQRRMFFSLQQTLYPTPKPEDLHPSDKRSGSHVAVAVSNDWWPNVLRSCVVVYDGSCHICHGGVRWLINKDKYKNIKFCCAQTELGKYYINLTGVRHTDVHRGILFVENQNSYHLHSSAILRLLTYLPQPYPTRSNILRFIPASLRDAYYEHLLAMGHEWFMKDKDILVLKEKELLDRFEDKDELLGED